MKPSQLSRLHSGVFRWLLVIITIFTVLLSLVSMLILATALRDHYAGDAELTTLGLQNVWTLVSFSIVTIIVSVLGGVGVCFHNDILLKVYGAVTLASLVVHFLMQGLGMLHLLEFTPHMMSDSGQQITGPICYKDLLSELRQRMDQPQAVMEELDQPRGRDPVLLALLERYANETSLYREIMRGDHHTNTPRPVKDAPRPVAIAEVDSSVAAPIKPRGNGHGREKDSAWHNRSDNQRRTRVIAGRGGATLPSSLQVPGLGASHNKSSQALHVRGAAGTTTPYPSPLEHEADEDKRGVGGGESHIRSNHLELKFQRTLLEMGSIQRRFQCCGASDYRDYLRQNMTVPSWCCRQDTCDRGDLLRLTLDTKPGQAAMLIYTEGCGVFLHRLSSYVNGVLKLLESVVVGTNVVGFLLVLGLTNCCRRPELEEGEDHEVETREGGGTELEEKAENVAMEAMLQQESKQKEGGRDSWEASAQREERGEAVENVGTGEEKTAGGADSGELNFKSTRREEMPDKIETGEVEREDDKNVEKDTGGTETEADGIDGTENSAAVDGEYERILT